MRKNEDNMAVTIVVLFCALVFAVVIIGNSIDKSNNNDDDKSTYTIYEDHVGVPGDWAIYMVYDKVGFLMNQKEAQKTSKKTLRELIDSWGQEQLKNNQKGISPGDLMKKGYKTKTKEGVEVFLKDSHQTLEGAAIFAFKEYGLVSSAWTQGNASVGGGVNAEDVQWQYTTIRVTDPKLGKYTLYFQKPQL